MTCTSEPEAVVQAVMINEFLADPPADESGDANGDGKRDGVQDEFIELVSLSASPVDLGGWSVQDGFGTRFTFLAGTDLMPGRALLVFGGEDGAIRDFAADFGAEVFVADGLGLNNDGDSLFLVDPDGTVIDTLTYGAEGGDNRSLTRATDGDPDAPFIPHPGDSPFSPGTRANGDLF
jgi:hypothetical protein